MNEADSAHALTAKNILTTFPIVLQRDPSAAALAEVTARILARRPEEIDRIRIYPVIGRLDGQLLDILAYDFKVDWWDPNYSLEEKRRVFKASWYVHKHMGTKAAVETAVSAIYPETKVEEWFEYGGKPYGFKIHLNMTGEKWDEERPRRILERVEYYKSLRSHLDGLEFTTVLPPCTLYARAALGVGVQMGVPQEADTPSFRSTLHAGGSFGSRLAVPVAEDRAPPSATTVLRTGGVCTILSNLSKGE